MRSSIVALALIALVSAQTTCSLSGTPLYGTFSTSGAFQVVRTECTTNGVTTYTNTLPAGSFVRTFSDIGGEADIFESASSITPLTIAARTNIFILVDASASQVGYIQQAVNIVVNGLRNGLNSNTAVYNNIFMAAASFDGRTDIQMISDWTNDWNGVLNTLSNQFANFNAQSPSDVGTNLNGAFVQAYNRLEKRMNDTAYGLAAIPSGILITTGDTVDTSGSYYSINNNFPKGLWDDKIVELVVSSGYRYGSALTNRANLSFRYNDTNPTGQLSVIFSDPSIAASAAQASQGYSVAKWCSPIRPVTYPFDIKNGDPNQHTVQFRLAGNNGLNSGNVNSPFNSARFSKGCDMSVAPTWSSAQNVKASAFIVVALAVLCAMF